MKMLITDIDGTITDEAGRIFWPAVESMRAMQRKGIIVGLVSGRPFSSVRLLGEYFGLAGPLIGENGGAGRLNDIDFTLGSRTIATNAVAVLSRQFELTPTWDDRYRDTDCAFEKIVDEESLRNIVDSGYLDVEVHVSSIMIHIARKGVSKRTGVEHCCRILGIDPGQVVVAGDSDSDLSLFEGFGLSVAPANSTPAILSRATVKSERAYGAGFCDGLLKIAPWLQSLTL